MDKGLQEELNRAFHSTVKAESVRKRLDEEFLQELRRAFYSGNTAIIQTIKNQLNSLYGITSIDKSSKYEKVTDTLFIFTKSRAEDLLRIRYYNIAHFVSSIFPHTDMIPTVEYTIELLNEYEGAVSLLWELEVISDDTAELYFEFCGELKVELINTRYDMFLIWVMEY